MRPEWEELPRGDNTQPWSAGWNVTLNKKGIIAFNRVTHMRLGEPQAVLILYDRVNNRIGLKPTGQQIRNAYPIAHKSKSGGRYVRAHRLLAAHGIDLPETLQFTDARIDDDGVLILDLRTARVSNRYRANPTVRAGRLSENGPRQ